MSERTTWKKKALLIIDSAPGHPEIFYEMSDGMMKVIFVPPQYNIDLTTHGSECDC
jgi:hypothetical protein